MVAEALREINGADFPPYGASFRLLVIPLYALVLTTAVLTSLLHRTATTGAKNDCKNGK